MFRRSCFTTNGLDRNTRPALRCGWKCAFLLLTSLQLVRGALTEEPTRIEARLLHAISTYRMKSGAAAEALLATPLCRPDGTRLPEGTTLRGVVTRVHKVGLGLIHETASMKLTFDRWHLPDGREFPAEVRLVEIDSARERIDSHSVIHGVRATSTLSNRFGQRLVFLAMGHPVVMTPLFILENSFFRFPDPEVEYRRGTELYLELVQSETAQKLEACPSGDPPLAAHDAASLDGLVNTLPYWSQSRRQRQPVDLVNLLFMGSQESLENAFQAAGWADSVPNSVSAGIRAVQAIVDDRSYRDAPMRTLMLDGKDPDIRLQKSLNTFEKRHHLRIWKRDEQWQGKQVWASAATEDVAATFGLRPFGFTHQIENDVDEERDKVVSDLRFTGCVDSVTYVSRPETLRGSGQPYRQSVVSDARVAVVVLNACTDPRLDLKSIEPLPMPSKLVRVVRRVTLTARNHFLRDNIFWRSADATRLAVVKIRQWREERRDERRGREADLAARANPPAPQPPPLR
jgi:hypothetical protein